MKVPALNLKGVIISSIVVENTGNLHDLAWDMAVLAKELNCVVVGSYNEVALVCEPGDSHKLLITHYRQFMDALRGHRKGVNKDEPLPPGLVTFGEASEIVRLKPEIKKFAATHPVEFIQGPNRPGKTSDG